MIGDLSYTIELENGNKAAVPRMSFMQIQRCYGLHLDYRRLEMNGQNAAAKEVKVLFVRFALGYQDADKDKLFEELMGTTNLERQRNLNALVDGICDKEMPELYLADGACYLNPRWDGKKQEETIEAFKRDHPEEWAAIVANNPALAKSKDDSVEGDEDSENPPAGGDTETLTSSAKSPAG
jgi:hypothetical protein